MKEGGKEAMEEGRKGEKERKGKGRERKGKGTEGKGRERKRNETKGIKQGKTIFIHQSVKGLAALCQGRKEGRKKEWKEDKRRRRKMKEG